VTYNKDISKQNKELLFLVPGMMDIKREMLQSQNERWTVLRSRWRT